MTEPLHFPIGQPDHHFSGETLFSAASPMVDAEVGPEPEPARGNQLLIGVVDPHSFTRECIARSLRELDAVLDAVGFVSLAEISQTAGSYDLIVLHVHWRPLEREATDGALADIRDLARLAPVIVIGPNASSDFVFGAFKAGVRGFIPTEDSSLDLVTEIMRLIKAGGTFVPLSSLSAPAAGRVIPDAGAGPFTRRETEVIKLLRQGKANKVIAYELQLSESTVKVHLRNIMRKLKATNRTEVVSRSLAII